MNRYWWIGISLLFITLAIMIICEWPEEKVKIVICNVGQGDGAVVMQGFSQMVVDVGQNDGAMIRCLGEVLPFWDRKLEVVIISHEDSDHAGGLEELENYYRVDKIIMTKMAAEKIGQEHKLSSNVSRVVADQRLKWGEVGGEILWPPDDWAGKDSNDSSLVLRLEFNSGKSIWWAGDAGELVEDKLLEAKKVRRSDILKVAHHGSKYGTTDPFLAILMPSQAFISVGKNRYGHPADEVLKRLELFGAEISRTDQKGMIIWEP